MNATSPTTDPATLSPATRAARLANQFDTGVPMQVGEGRWLHSDGTITSHDGFGPVVIPAPANLIDLMLLRRAYHKAKLLAAERCLRDLVAALRPGSSFRFEWGQTEERLFGPPPRTAEAAREHLEAVVGYHRTIFTSIDSRLRERHGIDPEMRDI